MRSDQPGDVPGATPMRTTALLPTLLASALFVSACGGAAPEDSGREAAPPAAATYDGPTLFTDVTAALGLPVATEAPADGAYFLPEMMQGGIGLFDYDLDGDLDLLHVRAPLPATVDSTISNVLYRQEADGRFVDVTEEAGLARPGFGQGLTIGDVDNDGDPDVYLTNFGPDEFYRNDGDGTFTRATEQAGFRGNRWSTAASFVDYDSDGFLDLFLVHYVGLDPEKRCSDPRDRREYCGPHSYRGRPDKLYRNRGDGTFEDVTTAAGIVLPEQGARATGLGTICTDFTGDGLVDFFVANDLQSNQLWVNQGDGTFGEEGILRGIAANEFGHPEASMGVTAGDANSDGELDLFMTHLWQENNRLFLGGMMFDDASVESSLSSFDLERTGWGCGFFDFDHDGDQDLVVANGGVRRRPPLPGAPTGMWAEYAEPNQLFVNDGRGGFDDAGPEAGGLTTEVEVSRGLAIGDLDADGDLDVIFSSIDNTLRVYRNDAPKEGKHWLQVRALTNGRDALGAQVRVHAGDRVWCTGVLTASSYLSSNDPRAHFGLGTLQAVDDIEVRWTDGTTERFGPTEVDRVVTVEQGAGR